MTPGGRFATIVVGTDGSERAGRAVARAVELAAAYDATLHIVHAYQGTRENVVEAANAIIDRVAAEHADADVVLRLHALQGDPADVMLDFAYDAGADLVIVGNRGMTGKGRILGSVPNAVAHEAGCAVMIVPTHREPGRQKMADDNRSGAAPLYRTIIVGTDGSPRAQRAVQRAAEMAERFGATVHLVRASKGVEETVAEAMASGAMVTPPPELEAAAHEEAEELALDLEAQAARLHDRGLRVETHSVSGSPAAAILETAEAVGADLIVVGNRGMTGAKRILGSVPNTLAHHAECAVLIVPTDD